MVIIIYLLKGYVWNEMVMYGNGAINIYRWIETMVVFSLLLPFKQYTKKHI